MDTKTIIIGASAIVGVVTIAGGGAYYSPYLTLNKMRNATENQKRVKFSGHILKLERRSPTRRDLRPSQLAGSETGAPIHSENHAP